MSHKGLLVLLLSSLSCATYAASTATCAGTYADIKQNKYTVEFQCREYNTDHMNSRRLVWSDKSISENSLIANSKASADCDAKSDVGTVDGSVGLVYHSSDKLFWGRHKTVCQIGPK